MDKFELIVPTLFGLEAFVKREIQRLGYEITSVEDGRVTFEGDLEAICRVNTWLRTGERVLIKAAEFRAESFEELFEGTKAVEWERWIGKDCAFPVKGYCLKSKLASERDCQSIIKKAVADRLSQTYGIKWFGEEGSVYLIRFSVLKDTVTLMIDASGEPLHKRGYRQTSNIAPLRETIAAAMVAMSRWKFEYPLCDPFCGSGTIPIEAAMFKRNIAPGLNRRFAAHGFSQIPNSMWERAAEEARSLERNVPLEIYASDIDAGCAEITRENARIAGVGEWVKPTVGDARKISFDKPFGTIITNPPYGERLGGAEECEELYRELGKTFLKLDRWSYYILASNERFEEIFGKKANKRRKIYNGMLKCNVYQYFGDTKK